jgi:RNA polymerase sigma-70 factor (ECF subfamily)
VEQLGPDDFPRWYEAVAPRLVARLTVVTGDRDAVDATAEAFVKAYERRDRIGQAGNPAGWVFTVALNVARRRQRRAARERVLLDLLTTTWSATVAEPRAIEVWSVARLPYRTRCAVTLRYLADFEEHEIAEVLGVTRGTVATMLHRARATLAEQLREEPEVSDV